MLWLACRIWKKKKMHFLLDYYSLFFKEELETQI